MDELQRILHGFRKDIDAVTQNVKTLRDNPVAMVCAREIALSITKLEEAKMWLGKALGETGSEMPAELADKANTPSTPAQPVGAATQNEVAPQAPSAPVQPNTDANVAPVNPTPAQMGVAPADQAQVAQDTTEQPL